MGEGMTQLSNSHSRSTIEIDERKFRNKWDARNDKRNSVNFVRIAFRVKRTNCLIRHSTRIILHEAIRFRLVFTVHEVSTSLFRFHCQNRNYTQSERLPPSSDLIKSVEVWPANNTQVQKNWLMATLAVQRTHRRIDMSKFRNTKKRKQKYSFNFLSCFVSTSSSSISLSVIVATL